MTAESFSPRVDRPSKNPHGTECLQISTKISLTLKFKFPFVQVFATAPLYGPKALISPTSHTSLELAMLCKNEEPTVCVDSSSKNRGQHCGDRALWPPSWSWGLSKGSSAVNHSHHL